MPKFQKVKTEHHILKEFHKLLSQIEKITQIHRIIPGRVNRQQKGSSQARFKISYDTHSGIKCIMSKGSTAQELFIISDSTNSTIIQEQIQKLLEKHKEISH